MNIPIITPIMNAISQFGTELVELRTVKAKGQILVAGAKAEAEAFALKTHAQNVADWERIQASNSATSWKDEWWTLLISLPVILAFIPQAQPYVVEGWVALSTAPEWYRWALGASIGASFGIRSGAFTKLGAAVSGVSAAAANRRASQ